MGYNKSYTEIENFFGSRSEEVLLKFTDKIDKSHSILDIGAGQGRNSIFFAQKGFRVDALDSSTVSYKTLKKESLLSDKTRN